MHDKNLTEMGWQWWDACLQMTLLFADIEEELQRVVDEFYSVCTRRKLKVNALKSKVIVFERSQDIFDTPYRVSVSAVERCEVAMSRENGGGSFGVLLQWAAHICRFLIFAGIFVM